MTRQEIADMLRELGHDDNNLTTAVHQLLRQLEHEVYHRVRTFQAVHGNRFFYATPALNQLLREILPLRGDWTPPVNRPRVVYVAHPIGGNVIENLADLRRIVRQINLRYPDVVPFVPYYADCVSLNDDVPEERERGIANDTRLIRTGVVDECWLTGERVSRGMAAEVALFDELGVPVVDHLNRL